MKDTRICHLDLKPANILISRNYVARITDFGESYHKEVCKDDFRPGRTIPYAAPEILKDSSNPEEKFTPKADVFSFGVLISDILFDYYPIESKKGS